MKQAKLKKLASVMLALVLSVMWVIPVMAVEIGESGKYEYAESDVRTTDTITIHKDLQVFNTAGEDIYVPDVTYTYTLSPASVTNSTVTISDGTNSVYVKPGIAGMVTLKESSIVFSHEDALAETTADSTVTATTLAKDVKKVRKDLTLNVSLPTTAAPGVYRYVLTDTTPDATLETAGIERPSDYVKVLYLDVYVTTRSDTDGNTKLAGYVLFRSTDGQSAVITENDTVAGGAKVTGYDIESEERTDDGYQIADNRSDKYHTYNLKVEKKVTGNYGDRRHDFPFTISLTMDKATTVRYTLKTAAETAKQIGTRETLDLGDGFRNNDKVEIIGLPVSTVFSVSETNDTTDTYKLTLTDRSDAESPVVIVDEEDLEANVSSTADELAGDTLTSVAVEGTTKANFDYLFENNLESVAPTGLLVRALPYVLMVGAAVILVVFLRRRHVKE